MEQNKQVAQDFVHAVGRGDVAALDKLLAPGATWQVAAAAAESHPLPGVQTREQFLAVAGQLRSLFPEGITYEIHGVLAEGDRVVLEASSDASTAGLDFRNRYAFVLDLHDGLVTSGLEYMDFAYLNAFQARLAALLPPTA